MDNKISPNYKRWCEAWDELERLVGEELPYESPKVKPEQWLEFWQRQFKYFQGYASTPLMRFIVENLKKAAK